MNRDPRIDPKDGDELHSTNGDRKIIIDGVEVIYRVVDNWGGLEGGYRISLDRWRELALEQILNEEGEN